jgi:plastocyanin
VNRPIWTVLGAFVVLVFATGGHCNDNNNMVGPGPTGTPVPGAPTPTPIAGAPTPTPSAGQTATVNVGQGGNVFVDQKSGSSTTTIHPGDTVRWVWTSGAHSTTSGTCAGGCSPSGLWDSGVGSGMTFTHTFTQAGTYPYFCLVHQSMMTGMVVVQ